MTRYKKRNFNDRVSHEEKKARVVEYFANHVEKGGGTLTLKEICDGCCISNNGHSGTAILEVCDEYKKFAYVHKIEIGVADRVRYEILVTKSL